MMRSSISRSSTRASRQKGLGVPTTSVFSRIGLRNGIIVTIVLLIALGAGGSRADVSSLVFVRPLALFGLCWMMATMPLSRLRGIAIPAWLLAVLTMLIGIQLIPLPPGVWEAMPGRTLFTAPILGEAGWRPLSISPDLTLNSLFSVIVPAAALIGTAWAGFERYRAIMMLLIGIGLLSALFAVVQLSGGPESPAYLYRITNEGGAVGLFANRNHQAVLLASLIPMLGLWIALMRRRPQRQVIALLLIAPVLVLIVVTGSRAGAIVAFLGLIGGIGLHARLNVHGGERERRVMRRFYLASILFVAMIATVLQYFSKATVFMRFTERSLGSDTRISNFGLFIEMIGDNLPFGTGFGTFDPAYRMVEPAASVTLSYLNHAHNDLAELLITGGLPAAVLLAAYCVWFWWATLRVLRIPSGHEAGAVGLLGALLIVMLFGASLLDYPLRTPLLAALFAVATAWLSMAAHTSRKLTNPPTDNTNEPSWPQVG